MQQHGSKNMTESIRINKLKKKFQKEKDKLQKVISEKSEEFRKGF